MMSPLYFRRSLPPQCASTDQDAYVYQPGKFVSYALCIHVSGIVKDAIHVEADDSDGDTVFDVALDTPYEHFINLGSRQYNHGHLHVEIICSTPIGTSAYFDDASAACGKDPDPLQGPYPKLGQHVWLEGRLVTNSENHLWVELHPLYRWGLVQP